MARAANKLTVAAVRALLAAGRDGRHGDGGGLWLHVTGPNRGQWSFRYTRDGRAREMGLRVADPDGAKGGVTLAEAREAAAQARRMLRVAVDPIDARRAAQAQRAMEESSRRTFREVADLYIAAHEPGWRSAKHRQQWRGTLDHYVHPTIGAKAAADVTTDDVLRILAPLWTAKPETAARVRGRVGSVLDYAAARGWRTGENPARWRGHLAHMLPPRAKVARVEHHAAIPWQQVPAFMARLRRQEGMAALALRFTILTAARTGETIGARWSEIDMDSAVWTVPAGRMKGRREHRVPLSDAALEVLRDVLPLRAGPDGFVFPGMRRGTGLSSMSMAAVLARMGHGDVTVHGMRSAFRDWCAEATHTPHAVAEAALAHAIPSATEAAYRRGDLFEKRRALMQQWADYCGRAPAEVVALHRRRRR